MALARLWQFGKQPGTDFPELEVLKEASRAAVSSWSPLGVRQCCWKREAGIPPWGTLCLAAGLLRCLSVPFLLLVMAGGALAAWEVLGHVSRFADACSMFFL